MPPSLSSSSSAAAARDSKFAIRFFTFSLPNDRYRCGPFHALLYSSRLQMARAPNRSLHQSLTRSELPSFSYSRSKTTARYRHAKLNETFQEIFAHPERVVVVSEPFLVKVNSPSSSSSSSMSGRRSMDGCVLLRIRRFTPSSLRRSFRLLYSLLRLASSFRSLFSNGLNR